MVAAAVVVVAVVEVVVEVVAAATWQSPLRLGMRLLTMGLLGSLGLMAPMAQRRRAGIATGSGGGATGASGSGAGIVTGTGTASTSGASGVESGAGMKPGVGVAAAAAAVDRTTGWKGWATTAEMCTWSLREATGTSLQRTGT